MKKKKLLNLINLPVIAMTMNAGTALAGTDTVAPAPSSVSTTDWLKVSGYAAIAYTYKDDGTETFADGNTPFDAIKVGFEGTYESAGAYASLFYTPGIGTDEAGILDAYAYYKFGGGFTVTAGKYLSWLGYEAFDAVNMTQITYANTLGAIPAYHNGIKLEYANDVFGAGVNVSDSIRGEAFWTGDEDFSDDQGYEAYVVYKGVDKLTLWGGVAHENTDDAGLDEFITYDLWASYDISEKITVAGEIAYHDSGTRGVQGLAFLKYALTDKFSTVFRFGIDDFGAGGIDNRRYTIAPTYAFCDNFLVRAELSFNDTSAADQDTVFSGIQAIAKF